MKVWGLDNTVNEFPKQVLNIIEDDAGIRSNLTTMFAMIDDIEVGIVANSAEDYFVKRQKLPNHKPDTLLLDIGLPGISGLDAIPKILSLSPNLDIIMLTTFEEESKILKAMCLGSVAYLSKRTSLTEIVNAIRIVHQGGSYMSPMIARDIFNYFVKAKHNPMDDLISARQKEVLEAMVDGKSHVQIGEQLFISPLTVRSHVKNIYKALHVKNKAEAITKYLKGSNSHL